MFIHLIFRDFRIVDDSFNTVNKFQPEKNVINMLVEIKLFQKIKTSHYFLGLFQNHSFNFSSYHLIPTRCLQCMPIKDFVSKLREGLKRYSMSVHLTKSLKYYVIPVCEAMPIIRTRPPTRGRHASKRSIDGNSNRKKT